jgi:hypothetical protein
LLHSLIVANLAASNSRLIDDTVFRSLEISTDLASSFDTCVPDTGYSTQTQSYKKFSKWALQDLVETIIVTSQSNLLKNKWCLI